MKFTTLHSFSVDDGTYPQPGIVQGINGDFYGATSSICQPSVCGSIFKITPSGTLTTVYTFCPQGGCADGYGPYAALVQANNGYLYGITPMWDGGPDCTPGACGTIFKMTPSGELTTLYNFCSPAGCPEGWGTLAGLVQAANGDLYGTTDFGGAHGYGTVFKITTSGALTTIYNFCSQSGCTDGILPEAGLIQAGSGGLYGTTSWGGIANSACANSQCGTIFKITPSGALTTLYDFCSQSACADGYFPAGLVPGGQRGSLWDHLFWRRARRWDHL